jgi:hypothetical protein
MRRSGLSRCADDNRKRGFGASPHEMIVGGLALSAHRLSLFITLCTARKSMAQYILYGDYLSPYTLTVAHTFLEKHLDWSYQQVKLLGFETRVG